MAHFAELNESNIVIRAIVVNDEHEADGENWCNNLLEGTWKQTSYNTFANVHALGGTPFRKNFAGIGMTYDATRDAFIYPQPYTSWTLNETTCSWEAPIAHSSDNKIYSWDEDAYQADNSTGWVASS
tara:strand:+ start:71 stop:451 length:381 start_codon:yes stop_codon:yes gene_type:complete